MSRGNPQKPGNSQETRDVWPNALATRATSLSPDHGICDRSANQRRDVSFTLFISSAMDTSVITPVAVIGGVVTNAMALVSMAVSGYDPRLRV